MISAKPDKRGNIHQSSSLAKKISSSHINLINPAVSHYRRKHVPNRRYLPAEMNAKAMYGDFDKQHSHVTIKCAVYWRQISKMKISFAKLGDKEICLEKVAHRKRKVTRYDTLKCISDLMNEMINDVDCQVNMCELCSNHEKHLERANISHERFVSICS